MGVLKQNYGEGESGKIFETYSVLVPSYGSWTSNTSVVCHTDGTLDRQTSPNLQGELLKIDNTSGNSRWGYKITALKACKITGLCTRGSVNEYENYSMTVGQEISFTDVTSGGYMSICLQAVEE